MCGKSWDRESRAGFWSFCGVPTEHVSVEVLLCAVIGNIAVNKTYYSGLHLL